MKKKDLVNSYWQDIDIRLEKLLEYGSVKLPSLDQFDLNLIANEISSEMDSVTFKESGSRHMKFLDELKLSTYLSPKLLKIAQSFSNYKGGLSNQYHIARKVKPGNSKEMYRVHFDSHIFTMVLPIKIPSAADNGKCGELVYFPKVRENPKSEIKNFLDKLYFKKYASKNGLENLVNSRSNIIDDFRDYRPLLFFGKTTLHTNYPVSELCTSYRLTLLAHFFDDTPRYGIGNLLRLFRRR